jgi:drug/metabolite transporter (DMT)-like permease
VQEGFPMLSSKLANQDLSRSPIFLVAPFFFLGTSMVVMKAVIPSTTPLFLAGFRLVPAGLLILALTLVFRLPQPKSWKAWLWIALFSLIDGAMFQGFLTEGLVKTGAGLGAVLIDAQPLVVAILSRILFGEVIGLWGWIGLIVGLVGISFCGLPREWILSLLHGDFGFFQNTISALSWHEVLQSGEMLMLFAALSMSFGTIIIRYVKQHCDAVVATGWHMLLGGLPLFALSEIWETDQWTNINLNGWMALGYATFFGTALTYGIFFYLASVGNLTSVSALIFLTPVFAMLFSMTFLSEALTQFQWIGVALTLVSVVLVIQREAISSQHANALGFLSLKAAKAPDAENILVETSSLKE